MATADQIAHFVAWYRHENSRAPYAYAPNLAWLAPQPTAEELADHFVQLAEFELLQLGGLLGTPDGELIATAVGMVIPNPYSLEYTVFVDGLKLAARKQQTLGRKRAGVLALALTGAVCMAAFAERS